MTVIKYREYEYWSVIHGGYRSRVSVADPHGREYWVIVETDGKGYRERRRKAIDLCVEAIELGCEPGEVRTA